jgi:hypothetical protein
MAEGKNSHKKASGRKGTLLKKAYELGKIPGFVAPVFIRQRGQITTFRSNNDESWWPLKSEVVVKLELEPIYN